VAQKVIGLAECPVLVHVNSNSSAMSDALNYLVKARGDALGHYFAFLKECGKHLDPKTRNLISVITKVDAQTERGFKQYLGRALREGCTPMEVLDALLMAFPTLGLAKIVWAVDIILAMDLPEFQPGALGAKGEWHDVMATKGFKVGRHATRGVRRPRPVRAPHRPNGASTTAAARTRPPTSRTWRCRTAR
jgi:alkylhydroperoxidase/carboxymuconolactone decarboxylase family protein YurZ